MRTNNYATLKLEEWTPHILLVSMNRPNKANALDTQMGMDIHTLFSGLTIDPRALRCVILTGVGQKAFCAGGDLKERDGMTDAAWQRQHVIFEHAFASLNSFPLPLIAAVNGAAYGGGCEIALCADFIFAADTVRFALTETSLGIIPGGGGTQNLSHAVGTRRAKELIFTAAPFSASQAQAWGMVNEVLPADELMPHALAVAERIASNAPIAVRQAKSAISLGNSLDLAAAMRVEIEAYNRTVPTEDRKEGVRAFNERRQPEFKGC